MECILGGLREKYIFKGKVFFCGRGKIGVRELDLEMVYYFWSCLFREGVEVFMMGVGFVVDGEKKFFV